MTRNGGLLLMAALFLASFPGASPAAERTSRSTPPAPSVGYSSFLGGDGVDQINDLAVTPDGSTYLVGETTSTVFPENSSHNVITPAEPSDLNAFVVKLNPGTASSSSRSSAAATETAPMGYLSTKERRL